MDEILILIAVVAVVGLPASCVGNYLGDQATLRDCATKDEARMMGGGLIKCEVKKEVKPQ